MVPPGGNVGMSRGLTQGNLPPDLIGVAILSQAWGMIVTVPRKVQRLEGEEIYQ